VEDADHGRRPRRHDRRAGLADGGSDRGGVICGRALSFYDVDRFNALGLVLRRYRG
jgi:hypothetical protein